MVKLLSSTFAPHDIRVNGIAPGLYASDLITGLYGDYDRMTSYGSVSKEFTPLTRLGGTVDIAGLILYMAGASGGNLNGQYHGI